MMRMERALALLLFALDGAVPAAPPQPPPVRSGAIATPDAGKVPRLISTAGDLRQVCAALVPAERLRPAGDPVEQGEAERRHDLARDRVIAARYEVAVPAAKLTFAPYDAAEGRLALHEPAQVPVAEGTGALWPAEERGLPVDVDVAAARRIVEAQRAARLELALVFDLPDDAACGSGARGRSFTLGVEPVAWAWRDGAAVLARGGAGADRPLLGAADGAKPKIDVAEPLAGGPEARRAVLAHAYELEACYAEALKRAPTLDGLVVAELGPDVAAIAADSVGDVDLAACVRRTLRGAGSAGRGIVPIRFELQPPAPPAVPAAPGAPAAPPAPPGRR
jgi:hypothetical protein